MPYIIPNKFDTYFKKHLHLIAELQLGDDKSDTGLKFGIFFTTRTPQRKGDPLFEGTAFVEEDPKITKPSWNAIHTLFLIPLSKEAEKSLKNKEIRFDRMRLTNSKTKNGKYSYPYFNISESDDLYLEMDQPNKLKIDKGHLYLLDSKDNKEQFPVIIIDEDFDTETKLFYFEAPRCFMYEEYNSKNPYYIWFGVRNDKGGIPFLQISKPGNENGGDCPLLWKESERLEDFLQKNIGQFNWELSHISSGGASKHFVNNTQKWSKSNDSISWLFLHDKESTSYRIISPIYSCFKSDLKIPVAFDTMDLQFLQIANSKYGSIYLRYGNWKPENHLNQLGLGDKTAELLSEVKRGRKAVDKSFPFSIAPEEILKNHFFNNGKLTVCSDYSYSINQYGQSSFNLLRTYLAGSIVPFTVLKPKLKLPVEFSNIIDVNKKNLKAQLNTSGDFEETVTNDNGTMFRIRIEDIEGISSKYLSISSLQFELNKTLGITGNNCGEIYFTLTRKSTERPFFLWQFDESIANDIELNYTVRNFKLPIKDIKPFGQDLLRKDKYLAPSTSNSVGEGMGERVQYPLIIPLNENKAQTKTEEKTRYILQISESINVAQNFRVDMQILKYNPEKNKDGKDNSSRVKAVIIDHNPQFTGLIDTQFIQDKEENDNEWIVAQKSDISNEDGAWEIANDAVADKGFKLILPSQSIGEAYVKNYKGENDSIEEGEPQENQKIEYRFSPPAVLTIAQNRFNKRYVAPAWNLKRIWGRVGDQAPGVPLINAQFESLYGLMSTLDPDNKTFIAELGSKLGDVPSPAGNSIQWKATKQQQQAFTEAYNYYLSVYRAWLSRLGILEPSQSDAFAKAEFSKELVVQPRFSVIESTDFIISERGDIIPAKDTSERKDFVILYDKEACIAYCKEGAIILLKKLNNKVFEITGPDIKYPIKSIEKQDELLDKIKLLHNTDGLAGGAFYGFEAEVIYKEFWKEFFEGKKSSSAEIKDLAFSSLGMWAKQTSRFAQDKTIIKNTTTMGRTHVYAVERIGRIGVFWNKAKHVIEYERTVVTSKQFPDQPDHNGRVLVRKVREYIEILEPTRTYPDYQGSAVEASGCVKAMTFKSKIIPVLGAWGKTVKKYAQGNVEWEGIGWEVPIWNKDADPEVYPKPQILVEALAGSDYHTQTVAVTISEPQNLYFYTDCREKVNYKGNDITIDANTNNWPAVLYTDYTLLPLPKQFDISPSASLKGEGLNAPMASPLDVYPGFERFTFRVENSQSPISVTGAHYPESTFTGKLRTVTMMRLNTKNSDLEENKSVVKDSTYINLFGEKSKPGVLQETANGFVEIENKLRSAQNISIKDYKDFISEKYINKVKELTQENNIRLKYLPENRDSISIILNNESNSNIPNLDIINSRIQKIEAIQDWDDNTDLLEEHTNLKNKKEELEKENNRESFWYGDSPTILNKINNSSFNFLVKPLWLKILEGADGLLFRADSFLDDQFNKLKKEIDSFTSEREKDIERFKTEVKRTQKELDSFRLNLDLDLERINTLFNEDILEKVKTFLEEYKKIFNDLLQNLDENVENAFEQFDDINEIIDQIKTGLNTINVLKTKIDTIKNIDITTKNKILSEINKIVTIFSDYINRIEEFKGYTLDVFKQKAKESYKNYRDQIDEELNLFYKKLHDSIDDTKKHIETLIKGLKQQIDQTWDIAWKKVDEIINDLEASYKLTKAEFDSKFEEIRQEARYTLVNLLMIKFFLPVLFGRNDEEICAYHILVTVDSWINNITNSIKQSLLDFIKTKPVEDIEAKIDEWLNKYKKFEDLKKAIEAKPFDKDEIISKSIAFANELNTELGEVAGHIAETLQKSDAVAKSWEGMKDVADSTLNNYRAVFEKFTAPGMGFNRDTISMIVNTDFKELEEKLSLTPVMGKVQEFEDRLNTVGINLPITAITDSLLPAKESWGSFSKSLLSNYDFTEIAKKIVADYTNMMPGFRCMEEFGDKIIVSQGFDRKELRGWVKAKIDNIAFNDKKTLFSLGSLVVELEKGIFFANMDADIDSFGNSTTKSTGTLTGSWIVTISGQELIRFEKAVVRMNDGKFNFDLDPQNIKMSGLLKILTDATKEMSKTGAVPPAKDAKGKKTDYFKVSVQKLKYKYDGTNEIEIPTGVKAAINIPNITIGAGTTSLSNLSFGAFFLLSLIDQDEKIEGNKLPKLNFKIGTGFYLSTREAPFNLSFFIFGGGGYFKCNIFYEPSKPDNGNGLTIDFAMSIHASACFAFNAGWMNGSLMIAMGLEGEFVKKPKEADISRVAMFVMLSGNADIMGMVTISLYVRLEATYTKSAIGTQIQGKGMIRVKIEVCRFVTITVQREFTKVFSGPGEDSSSSSENVEYDTDEILNSLA